MATLSGDLRQEMAALSGDLRQEMADLRVEVKTEIVGVDRRLEQVGSRLAGLVIGAAALVLAGMGVATTAAVALT